MKRLQILPSSYCRSAAQSCLTLCDPMDCSMPGLSVPHHILKFAQVQVHCISDAIQLSHPLTPSSPALKLSQHHRLFQCVSFLHQMTKIMEFQLQHESFSAYSWLISFTMDWLDLLAVQETLKHLLQHHTPKASILQCSAFFIAQLSHPDMTTG